MWLKTALLCSLVLFFVNPNLFTEAQIIQPNVIKDKNLFNVPEKVEVNPLKLKEVEKIRQEIKSAVVKGSFIVRSEQPSEKNNEDLIPSNTKGLNSTKESNSTETLTADKKSEPVLKPGTSVRETNKSINHNESIYNENSKILSGNVSIADDISGKGKNEKSIHLPVDLQHEQNETNLPKVPAKSGSTDVKASGKNESEQQVAKGPVVQPDWTDNKPKEKLFTGVKVTAETLKETDLIRGEIQEAVKKHTHVIGFPGDNEVIQEVDEYYKHKFRLRQFWSNLLGSNSSISDENDTNANTTGTIDAGSSNSQEHSTPEVVPNIVDSQVVKEMSEDEDDMDQSPTESVFDIDLRYRRSESLNLKSIEENFKFDFGEGVSMWKVSDNNQQRVLLVGVMDSKLIFVSKSCSVEDFKHIKTLDMNKTIIDFEIFVQWNSTSKHAEEFVIIAFQEQVACIDVNTFSVIIEWNIGRRITGIKYYKTNEKHFIAALTNSLSDTGFPSINIYQFDMITNDFWLNQIIPLEFTCSEIVFLDTGRDIILAVPQINATIIFTYTPNPHDNVLFKNVFLVESEGVESISGFQMGGFSYLAISGSHPKILRYHRGEFFPQTIFGQSFQYVERFLPVAARTYRDDLILFVQHRINYETHFNTVVENLIWDGETFQTSLSVPCKLGNFTYQFGASCMIDIERDDGMKGAAVISIDGDISVLVPRMVGPSGLFKINIELIDNNSDQELEHSFEILKTFVQEQKYIISEAQKYVKEQDWQSRLVIEYLECSEITLNEGDIDHIFINGLEQIENDTNVNITEILDLLEDSEKEMRLLEDVLTFDDINPNIPDTNRAINNDSRKVRERRSTTLDVLEVDNIATENLVIKQINGIPVEDVSFIKNNSLIYNGTIVIEGDLIINNSTLSEKYKSAFDDRTLTVDALDIDGDLIFETINNIPWRDIILDVVLVNMPDDLEELVVDGEVIAEDVIHINKLNTLNFPDDYLLSSGPESSVVRARKVFHNVLAASIIHIEGDINGIDTNNIITLSGDQRIPGVTIFSDIEVTEMLEVFGQISGTGLDHFQPNPNLLQSNEIDSNCEFEHLEVNGPVFVSQLNNNINLDAIFTDVVHVEDKQLSITSSKLIKTAIFEQEVIIKDEKINNIHLDEFVTTNTEQDLDIAFIAGKIKFNFLELQGLFDSVNITDLNENSVKLYGGEETNIELIFEDYDSIRTVDVLVSGFLNKESVNNFRTIFDNLDMDYVSFSHLVADSITSNCDITGSTVLNGVDLIEFDKKRLSLTLNQNIATNVVVNDLTIGNNAHVQVLNDLLADSFLSLIEQMDNPALMIQSGRMKVRNLHIIGDITTNVFNGLHFDTEIQNNVIWLNRPNFIRNELKFLDAVVLDGDLIMEGYINNEKFQEFLDDLVFKTDEVVMISQVKKFTSQIHVLKDIRMFELNNIPVTELVTKNNAIFKGSVEIGGSLMLENLQLSYYLNDYDVNELLDSVGYSEEFQTFVIRGEVLFKGQPVIEDIHVYGSIGDIENLDELFSKFVYKSGAIKLTGTKLFKNTLNFKNGLAIDTLNGFDLNSFFENFVFINKLNETVIETPVIFLQPVDALSVYVRDALHTSNLMGCSIQEWIENGLRTDLPADIHAEIHFSPGTLNFNSLNVLYVNEKLTSSIISLHIPQNLSGHFYFSDLYLDNSLEVENGINGVDIMFEKENTIMVNGNQHITAPSTMYFTRVLHNLNILSCVKGKDLTNVAHLASDIQLISPLSFKNMIAKNVVTNDLISGIDFSGWYQNSLWINDRNTQTITGNWTVEYMNVKEDIDGKGLVNGVSMVDFQSQINTLSPEKVAFFKQLDIEKGKICLKTQNLVKKTQQRVYFFKYFDKSFKILEDGPVNRLIFFMDDPDIYLLTNVYCYSNIYRWDQGKFVKINGMESGVIKEIVAVPAVQGGIYIVTSTENNSHDCNIFGTNVWYFDLDEVNLISKFDDRTYDAIHYSPEHFERFYGIDEKNNLIVEVNLKTKNTSSWNLPVRDRNDYRFLPYNAGMGIALSDGQNLLMINNKASSKARRKRFLTTKLMENSVPDSIGQEKLVPESIFALRSEQKAFKDIPRERMKLIDSVKDILMHLINDLHKELEFPGNPEEKVNSDDLKDMIKIFQNSFANTSLEEFSNTSMNFLHNYSFTDESTVSGFKMAKILLTALVKVKDIQDIANRMYNTRERNSTKEETSEVLNKSKLVNFESILTTLAVGFRDVYNISTRSGNLSRTENVVASEQLNLLHKKMASIVQNIENELRILTDLTNSYENAKDSQNKSLPVDYIKNILNELIIYLKEGIQSKNNSKMSSAAMLKELINQAIEKNITLSGLIGDLSNISVTDVQSSIADAAVKLLNVSLIITDYESHKHHGLLKEAEVVGFESPITFEGILTILNGGFIDLINIALRRKDDFLGHPLSNQTDSISDYHDLARGKIASIVENLEKELNSLDTTFMSGAKEDNVFGYNSAKYFNSSSSVNETQIVPQNNSELAKSVKNILVHLIDELTSGIKSEPDSVMELSSEDYKYFMEKLNELFENATSQNSSKESTKVLSEFNTIAIPSISLEKSTLNSAKKLLNASVFITSYESLRYAPNKEDKEMVGFESPITFEGILTILNSGIINIFNNLIRRRDDLLGSSLKDNNQTTTAKKQISSIISKLKNEIEILDKVIKTNEENTTVNINQGKEEQGNAKDLTKSIDTDSPLSTLNVSSEDPFIPDYMDEPIIAYEIPDSDLLVAYNEFLPSKSSGEILALKVGSVKNRKKLIAVTHSKVHLIAGQHDTVKLYFDIEEGHLFQTISTFKPRSLTALHIRDETILAFVEDTYLVRVFSYRGVEGFTEILKFKNPEPITILTSASLPEDDNLNSTCLKHYLAVVATNRIQFYEAKLAGNCGIDEKLNCND